MRKRNKKLISFADILNKTGSKLRIKKGLTKYMLWEDWKKIVPENIAKNTKPIRWNGDVLYIATTTPTWSQELTFLKPELINRIKEHDPKIRIKDIRFETGYKIEEKTKEEIQEIKRKSLSTNESQKLEEWTKTISDDELKKAIKIALTSVLTRK